MAARFFRHYDQPMIPAITTVFTAIPDNIDVNPWGALGCAVAFAASLFAILDALGDYAHSRSDAANALRFTGHRLKFGSKISAAAVTSIAAGVVLALDNNWWTLAALVVAFAAIILWSGLALSRAERTPENQ